MGEVERASEGELHTTIDVVRRLVDLAGIQRSSPKVCSARQRRRATDQREPPSSVSSVWRRIWPAA